MRITPRSSSAARCCGMAGSTVRCRFCARLSGKRVNTGVWGTAAFPSIYSTRMPRWQFLPHSPLWMAVIAVAAGRRHCGPADGDRHLVGSLRRGHARLDDHRPAVCDVCVAVRSQRPTGHRPVVAHAESVSLPRADRMVAPAAAHCAVLGKSARPVAVARGRPPARHASSLEDPCAVAPQRAGGRTAVDRRWQRAVVLE